jgi:hypothetical protein
MGMVLLAVVFYAVVHAEACPGFDLQVSPLRAWFFNISFLFLLPLTCSPLDHVTTFSIILVHGSEKPETGGETGRQNRG